MSAEEALAKLDKQVAAIIASNPPNPDTYPRRVCGYFLDPPARGSIKTDCEHCGGSMMLGPQSQLALLTVPGLRKLCVPCSCAIELLLTTEPPTLVVDPKVFDPFRGRES